MRALSLRLAIALTACAAAGHAQVVAPPRPVVVVGRPNITVPAGYAAVAGPRYFLAVPDTIAGLVRTARRIDYPDRTLGTLLRYAVQDGLAVDLYIYSYPLPAEARTCTAACADSAAFGEMQGFVTAMPLIARERGYEDLSVGSPQTLPPPALATWYSVYFVRMTFRERGREYVSDTYIFAMDNFAAKVRASYPSTWADAGPRVEAFALAAAGGLRPVPFDAAMPMCRAGRPRDAPIQVSVSVEQPPDTLFAMLQRAVADLGYTRSRADTTSRRLVTVPRFSDPSAEPPSGTPPWRALLGRSGHSLLMLLTEAAEGRGTHLAIVSRAVCNVSDGSAGQGRTLTAALDSAAREVLRRVVALSPPPGR